MNNEERLRVDRELIEDFRELNRQGALTEEDAEWFNRIEDYLARGGGLGHIQEAQGVSGTRSRSAGRSTRLTLTGIQRAQAQEKIKKYRPEAPE